jgi:SIR2-like domain
VAGHLLVIHGDLLVLDCDVALVPTDGLLRVEASWHGLVTEEEARSGAPAGWPGRSGSRSIDLGCRQSGGPRRVLVQVATEGSEPVQWYVDGVREALSRARDSCDTASVAATGRSRPLVALPLVGTGLGGSGGRRGELIPPILDLLEQVAVEGAVDVVLVTYGRSDYAAVQAARAERGGLPDRYEQHARRLGDLAARGDLVPFIGAGVSAAVGLPAWWELLERVAEVGRLLSDDDSADGSSDEREDDRRRDALRDGLRGLGTLDAAELLRTVLGREAVEAVVRELDADRHSLSHGLLASLAARRAVTTNYDRLYELASARPLADRGGLSVLPWDAADLDRPWLLKLHGDVGRPDSIVLSRGDVAGFDATRRPLASLLQAQMLTGHLLFVGSSMTDDAVVRLAWEVRELFRAWDAPVRVVGTVLGLHEEPLRARLWQDVLTFVPLSGLADDLGGAGSGVEPSDALPVFLDRLAQLASRERSFLLDPRYAGMVAEPLRPLHEALSALGSVLRDLPDDADPAVVEQAAALLRAFGWDRAGERSIPLPSLRIGG